MRKIYLHGEISESSFRKLSKKLDELSAESLEPIEIELASEGGLPYYGLAMYSKIRSCRCQINITAIGPCMSAASIVLAAGDVRSMATDAWFMVHETLEAVTGRLTQHQTAAIQMTKEELQWADILARHSDWSIKQWRRASKKTTFLTAFQLKKINLIHHILPTKGVQK